MTRPHVAFYTASLCQYMQAPTRCPHRRWYDQIRIDSVCASASERMLGDGVCVGSMILEQVLIFMGPSRVISELALSARLLLHPGRF